MTVVELSTLEEVKKFIEDNDKVVVDFWAPWCGPCQMMKPIFKQVSELDKFKDVKFGAIDVEAHADVGQEYQIASLPTLKVFISGKFKDDIIGFRQKPQLEAAIEEKI
ncbi:thioredoxin [Candidatus Woesearchaeota archaeon]|nr:thioredoxin [Candidatus Woesearchaeota archaeon]